MFGTVLQKDDWLLLCPTPQCPGRPRELDYQLNERSEVGNVTSPAVSPSADVKVPFATVPDQSAVHCQWVGLVQC